MRTLSLVECVELSFSGSVLEHGICFGDCDNDGLCEFIVGTTDGELSVFRESRCLCKAIDLGAVSAVGVGDLLNISRNVLVAVTIEGWVHVFDVENELKNQEKILEETTTDAETKAAAASASQQRRRLQRRQIADYLIFPFHSQRIPPNTKTLHLEDVNGDGLVEMVVGLTDRVLRTYQWKVETNTKDTKFNKEEFKEEHLMNEIFDGRLYGMNKWEFANQIGSVALQRGGNGGRFSMLVSHTGGLLTHISEIPRRRRQSTAVSGGTTTSIGIGLEQSTSISAGGSTSATLSSDGGNGLSTTLGFFQGFHKGWIEMPPDNITMDYYDLNTELSVRMNPLMTTEVIGNIAEGSTNDCYALAAMDGTVLIARENKIVRKYKLNAIFLALRQLDGRILACSGNGDIFIIERYQPQHYYFEERVAAFEVGSYAIGPMRRFTKSSSEADNPPTNRKCFACVSFQQRVYIYPIDVLKQ
jgi:hypothetical protein